MVVESKKDCLTIKIFDVGHGDSILVEFPDGISFGIIDCNTNVPTNRGAGCDDDAKAEPKILAYLRDKFKARSDYVVRFLCLSHYHIDHYRGMGCLVRKLLENNILIEEFWDPGISQKKFDTLRKMSEKGNRETIEKTTQLMDLIDVLNPLREADKLQHKPIAKMEQKACVISDVEIDIIAPYCNHWSGYVNYMATSENFTSQKEHLVCSGIMMTYGKRRIILGSDLSSKAWEKIVEKHEEESLRSHFVKVSHHGSEEGNFLPGNQSLWTNIAFSGETVSAISGGYRSDISLDKVIRELRTLSIPIYCTGNFLKKYHNGGKFLEDIPTEAKELYSNDSRSAVTNHDSYHGDISVYIERDGLITVEPELMTTPL